MAKKASSEPNEAISIRRQMEQWTTGPLPDPRHERFVQELMIGKSQIEAYTNAGFAPNDGASCRLAGHVRIRARLKELQEEMADAYKITPERVMRELALLGFSNMSDYAQLLKDGNLSAVDRDKAAAITAMDVDSDKGTIKIRLADKRAALVDLGKIVGLFKETAEAPTNVNVFIERTARSK